MAAHRVDFVHEDDARAVALGLIEQIAHAGRAHAHEHLHKFGTADAEERHARFAGNGLGQQRLARARAADQQHALGNARAQRDEFLRLFQELDHFLQILLGFFRAGHIFKRHRGMLAGEHARAALAERHRLIVGALRLPEHEVDQAHDEQAGQQKARSC